MIQTDFVANNLVARLFRGEVFVPSRANLQDNNALQKTNLRLAGKKE